MTETRIAVALVDDSLENLSQAEPSLDFWEVRMDLIGPHWPRVVNALRKPWIACNRRPQEGGQGQCDEAARIAALLEGLNYGPAIVDIELASPLLTETVPIIRQQARCLISYHNFTDTPELDYLSALVRQARRAGADIAKIVTTARAFQDNLTILSLIKNHPDFPLVAFAMGPEGRISRVLAPLAGAYFTFASLQAGKESASGQIPAAYLKAVIDLLR